MSRNGKQTKPFPARPQKPPPPSSPLPPPPSSRRADQKKQKPERSRAHDAQRSKERRRARGTGLIAAKTPAAPSAAHPSPAPRRGRTRCGAAPPAACCEPLRFSRRRGRKWFFLHKILRQVIVEKKGMGKPLMRKAAE
ncbi:hypothetical protein ZWY2020_001814 [Hordeum vulgare]|nr:hypothetical protein ZWY2020_001814 [Hordeum vulgare]